MEKNINKYIYIPKKSKKIKSISNKKSISNNNQQIDKDIEKILKKLIEQQTTITSDEEKSINNKSINNNTIEPDYTIFEKLLVEKELITNSNVFFNNTLYMNNSLNLPSEIIDIQNTDIQIQYTDLFISVSSYKYLLSNVINSIAGLNGLKDTLDLDNKPQEYNLEQKSSYSSIKFYSEKNKYLAPSIISVNKKFNIGNEIIFTTGLFYVIFIKNKILVAKPIMDTFVLINKKYKLINVLNDSDFINEFANSNSHSNSKSQSTEYETESDTESDELNPNIKINQEQNEIIENINEINKKMCIDNKLDYVENKNKSKKEQVSIDDFFGNLLNKIDEKQINKLLKDLSNNNKK